MAAVEIKGCYKFYCNFSLKEKERRQKCTRRVLLRKIFKEREGAFTLTVQNLRFNDISSKTIF